ncbi:MAG: tail fiber domain-containing protein [Candidatus Gastranaerophilaceae bacterium]
MDNKKHGYTLAEIMVVLLVLTIIFAAFAPVFTKRRQVASTSKYNVWQYHDRVQFNAFYNPGDQSLNGEAFIGITPEDKGAISTTFLPLSKLIIRSSKSVTSEAANQRHIQFRYRSATKPEKGDFAGIWYMDGKNVLMGGTYQKIDSNSSEPAMNNTAIGYDALSKLETSTYNTALGYNALNSVTKNSNAKSNTAIGYNAGVKNNSTGNTFIGYYAGYNSTGKENTYIGYGVSGAGSGDNNTFIGAFAGPTTGSTSKNTAIGYKALSSLTEGDHNIAIGAYALNKLQSGSSNTAIGYNACSEIKNSSNKTCIGANSGPHSGTASEKYLKIIDKEDKEQRTYIGGQPNGYTGDAVLEIHNVDNFDAAKAGNSTVAKGDYSSTGFYYIENGSRSNTTTVINGNLIVRGRPYFTVGSNLYHFHDRNTPTGQKYRLYGYGGTGSGAYFATCANNSSSYDFATSCVNLYPTKLSDRRLKDIGAKSTIGMDDLRKINVYNFTFKNDKDKKPQVGVIAQELQKVFPNSVVKGDDGYLRIKWDEMFYAAINAVKELDKRLVALVKRTTNVETQISKLERENSSLKAQVESLTTRVNKLKAQ